MNPVQQHPEVRTVVSTNGAVRPSEDKDWFWKINWDAVHKSVKSIFEDVTNRTTTRWPWIKSVVGQSSGTGVPFVYCYCSFEDPMDGAIDPAVLGLTFTPVDTGRSVAIAADICGESSGKVFFEWPLGVVSNSLPEIIAAATELAKRSGDEIDVIHEALQQPTISED